MDQFISNLSNKHKAALRQHCVSELSLGESTPETIEEEFWEDLSDSGETEDITNDIIVHYTGLFRSEMKAIAKEFVDSYGNQ